MHAYEIVFVKDRLSSHAVRTYLTRRPETSTAFRYAMMMQHDAIIEYVAGLGGDHQENPLRAAQRDHILGLLEQELCETSACLPRCPEGAGRPFKNKGRHKAARLCSAPASRARSRRR